jgi:hypothetical protein
MPRRGVRWVKRFRVLLVNGGLGEDSHGRLTSGIERVEYVMMIALH